MKIKKIRIRPLIEFDNDLLAVARELDEGKIPKLRRGVYFESLDAVRTILTDKRLDLWRAIRDRKPESISSLAQIVNRDFRAVHRDVKLLELLELVSLRKTKGKRGDLRAPVSLADELRLEVA